MILVKGDDDEIWQAQVKHVLFAEKLVKGYFFVKHHNWNEKQAVGKRKPLKSNG